ncbi:helix-turn-helix domain-containing protein [Micromonospora sp. CPCC 205371]|nr:helix-turn-helix domain-containing protein [Micromonospora sp. CPCC 205371]
MSRRPRAWTDEQIERLVSERRAGKPIRALAAEFGLPESTVSMKLRALGVQSPPRYRVPDTVRQQIIDAYRDGASERQAAVRAGVSRDTARRVLNQAGVPRRPRGGTDPPPSDRSPPPATRSVTRAAGRDQSPLSLSRQGHS